MDDKILSALQQATTSAVAASSTPTLPIKYVGLTFVPPSNQRYLECVFIPNNFVDQYWDRSRVYRGIYRLVLHWGIDGNPYAPLTTLTSVAAYFSKYRQLASGVHIVNEPDTGGIIETGHEIIWPATMTYRLFQPN